jgi:hypothetical protein
MKLAYAFSLVILGTLLCLSSRASGQCGVGACGGNGEQAIYAGNPPTSITSQTKPIADARDSLVGTDPCGQAASVEAATPGGEVLMPLLPSSGTVTCATDPVSGFASGGMGGTRLGMRPRRFSLWLLRESQRLSETPTLFPRHWSVNRRNIIISRPHSPGCTCGS